MPKPLIYICILIATIICQSATLAGELNIKIEPERNYKCNGLLRVSITNGTSNTYYYVSNKSVPYATYKMWNYNQGIKLEASKYYYDQNRITGTFISEICYLRPGDSRSWDVCVNDFVVSRGDNMGTSLWKHNFYGFCSLSVGMDIFVVAQPKDVPKWIESSEIDIDLPEWNK